MKHTNTIRYTILGASFGLVFPLVSSLLWIYQQNLSLSLTSLIQVQINNPLQWIINTAPLFLGVFAYFAGVRQDRVVKLNEELELSLASQDKLINQLNDTKGDLELLVGHQVTELKAAAQIAREAANIRNLEELLEKTVNLISDKFDFYHAGIFLLDDAEQYAVLQAASSDGGQSMLARHHKLKIGKVGIVGHVADNGEPRIALDVGTDAVYFDNPDLPQTRSEMSLPLKVREKVIGVLDIQSIEANAFTQEDISIMQTLADQIALAIDNARLLTESQQSLIELYRLYETQVAQAWNEYLFRRTLAYEYSQSSVKAVTPSDPSSIPEIGDQHVLNLPISFRGQTLGTIVLCRDVEEDAWSQDEIALARGTISQLALSLENARLMEATYRQAERDRIATDITSKLWNYSDIDTILQTAIRELGQSLEVSDALIELNADAIN
ncbi:MAG: GAF domain-containing protein [Anaerolineales bacterium]|nr:GAF domain-containing protein [Anaerolineales bacterium]